MNRRPPLRLPQGSRRATLAARAAERLRESILRGEVDTDRPLREEELSKRLGISRIPVREALRQLEGEGFVEIRPRRGAVVASLSTAEIGEIAEICRLLESRALELAVPGMTRETWEVADEQVRRMDELDDPVEWARSNWSFHATLYRPAGRPRMLEIVGNLRANAERYMYVLLTERATRRRLNKEHRRILDACRCGSGKRAGRLLDAHLSGGKDTVVGVLQRAKSGGRPRATRRDGRAR